MFDFNLVLNVRFFRRDGIWCRWHVLKNAKDRLGNVYSKHKRFKREFIGKYKLTKNKFLKRIFATEKVGQTISHGCVLC
jgi:hypothetical protein